MTYLSLLKITFEIKFHGDVAVACCHASESIGLVRIATSLSVGLGAIPAVTNEWTWGLCCRDDFRTCL